jgi:hypothetical protein
MASLRFAAAATAMVLFELAVAPEGGEDAIRAAARAAAFIIGDSLSRIKS